MSEAQSAKAIIAESILENFEAVHSYVARQSLRDMLNENQALRDERDRLRRALEQVSFHLAQPGDDETPHNQYVPSAAEVGTCQVIILAALTPGTGGTRR